MRSTLWLAAALVAEAGCGDGNRPTSDAPTLQPKPAPFGLDARPSNPGCVARPRPVLDTRVALERQWPGVTFLQPVYLAQAPGEDGQWYVVEREGAVLGFATGAASDADTRFVVKVQSLSSGEGGLLGLAFHPRWPAQREAYLSYTRKVKAGDPPAVCPIQPTNVLTSVISRFHSLDNGLTFAPQPDEVLVIGQPYTNHKGGGIQFGPDGYLYFGLGDGGDEEDPCGSGQNTGSLLGKMLRIDIDAPAGTYKVPVDNPFVGDTRYRPEIWSYGFRNPWRWSFDRVSGDLWVGDVGQSSWEEVDRVGKGGNYGWNICEGFHKRDDVIGLCATPGLADPVVELPRSDAKSITGGYVYRGSAMPSLVGSYIFGDYTLGNIWALVYDASNRPVPKLLATVDPKTLVSFGQGNDGELYTVQITGAISKLVPAAPAAVDPFPQQLSDTGCVDPSDPTQPAPGLIGYSVNSPAWSDGADQARYIAIPDGAAITITADQDWDLPIGSVALQTLSRAGKPIETRLLMRHDDGGWAGYSYEWDADGRTAALLPAGKRRVLGDGTVWTYPGRDQCRACHNQAAGGTLGLETAQLNRDQIYTATNRISNQLATFDHIGLFAPSLAQPPSAAPRLPDPAGTAPLDARARSYLHANCAGCHQPSGGGQSPIDLRFSVPFSATATCNAPNTHGAIGAATQLIAPGAPDASVLALRLHASDIHQMPPLANRIDPLGTQLVDDWIRGLTACPP
jgi:uncharacterized repeat protein (TIGR03806 family)